MKNKRFKLYSISEERGVLLGVATVIVMLFHSYSLHFEEIFASEKLCSLLNYIKNIGNIGVDIFLFVSAFGLYFSFSKDSNIAHFYKKRLLRIVPSAVIIASIYYLHVGTEGILEFLKKVCLLSFYECNDRDFWFLSFIIVMYILFPVFYKVQEKYGSKGIIIMIVTVIFANFLLRTFEGELYARLEIALTRIPIFLVAIIAGKKAKNRDEISGWWVVASFIAFIAINIVFYNCTFESYYIVRYLYGVLTVAFIIVACTVNDIIRKYLGSNGIISKFLSWIGLYSLEIYLIYEKLALELRKTDMIKIGSSVMFYIFIMLITLVISSMLKNINARISRKLRDVNP